MRILLIAALVLGLGGCSTTTDEGAAPSSTKSGSTSVRDDAALEAHLAPIFTGMFDENSGSFGPDDPDELGGCMAREIVTSDADGLAEAGITVASTTVDVTTWLDSILADRITGRNGEPFDRYVDSMWACGFDEIFADEFRSGLLRSGNTDEASDCLVGKVIGDRHLRLALVVGIRPGTSPDPSVEDRFTEPLIDAVDDAAAVCGVENWRGS